MLHGPSAGFQQQYQLDCLEALAMLPIRNWTSPTLVVEMVGSISVYEHAIGIILSASQICFLG